MCMKINCFMIFCAVYVIGSMGTIQAASPSDYHEIVHTYTTGIVSCDLDVMQSKKAPQEAIKSLFF